MLHGPRQAGGLDVFPKGAMETAPVDRRERLASRRSVPDDVKSVGGEQTERSTPPPSSRSICSRHDLTPDQDPAAQQRGTATPATDIVQHRRSQPSP